MHKVLSTPSAPEQAILKGIEDLNLTDSIRRGDVRIVHGTTVATNATLEGKGVRTIYIANKGLKDVLLIGRQTRSQLYSLTPAETQLPIDPTLMIEVSARVDSNGNVITPFADTELVELKSKVDQMSPDAVAINLLFSYLNDEHEQAIEALFDDEYFVSRSSDILPEYREYERGVTTWINGWIGPLIRRYLKSLQTALAPSHISIMQSSGLTISASQAADRAVNLLLSGPAGGLSAAMHLGSLVGQSKIMTFDMGGTSTDVALIDGRFSLTNNGAIAGYPVGVPMADIHTIGAGGGSIAYLDDGGLLRVGPRSAGAVPGPACYGQGGNEPTVTDANLVLGRLGDERELADGLSLDRKAAETALQSLATPMNCSLEDVALGIVQIANEHMTQALRVISIEKGIDPREFSLMCFGGAGGMHLCDLADALQVTSAIVPIHGGVLSALGMLTTNPGRELVRTIQTPVTELDSQTLDRVLDELAAKGGDELRSEGVTEVERGHSLDMRYEGQTFTLNVSYDSSLEQACDAFHRAHKQQYGHQMDRGIEVLNCRVHIESKQVPLTVPKIEGLPQPIKSQTIERESLAAGSRLEGPMTINEAHSTTYLKIGWHALVDEFGNLRLSRNP